MNLSSATKRLQCAEKIGPTKGRTNQLTKYSNLFTEQ
jgi:hypothetical protein